LTGLALLAPLAGAADPALLEFLMPDARLVVGIDIAHMRESPLSASSPTVSAAPIRKCKN
jgi:hypothetical protein